MRKESRGRKEGSDGVRKDGRNADGWKVGNGRGGQEERQAGRQE
jgi:hypothetical protein